jgi:hypothetical protein
MGFLSNFLIATGKALDAAGTSLQNHEPKTNTKIEIKTTSLPKTQNVDLNDPQKLDLHRSQYLGVKHP